MYMAIKRLRNILKFLFVCVCFKSLTTYFTIDNVILVSHS